MQIAPCGGAWGYFTGNDEKMPRVYSGLFEVPITV